MDITAEKLNKAFVAGYQKALSGTAAKQKQKADDAGLDAADAFEGASAAAATGVMPTICGSWPMVRMFLNSLLAPLALFMPGRVALAKGVLSAVNLVMTEACKEQA